MAGISRGGVKKKRGIWLVGGTLDSIKGNKLPSNQQVLSRFFHVHSNEKQTINTSATITASEVMRFWETARIPTTQKYNVINKIKDLHSRWQKLKKSASRRTETQLSQEAAFVDILNDLFDVAHQDALTLIMLAEDKEFLLAQREKGRRGSMGAIDTKLARKEERCRERERKNDSRKHKETERILAESATLLISESSSSENSSSESSSSESEPPVTKRHAAKTSDLANILSPEVSSALDRSKISDRNAMYVLAATAHSLGHNPQNILLNRESIRKARRKHRQEIANEIKASFAPNVPLTVHWDGKLLQDLTSKDKVDRLAVLVSGEGVMKLLGVPKIANGTGEEQANAVFNLLEDWKLSERVTMMSFDTTPSNTGVNCGACVLLEKKVKRDLLSLPCRHHILELIVESVFNALMGPSSGPNIKLFQRFAGFWTQIKKEEYESGVKVEAVAIKLNPVKDELLEFIKSQLSTFQPRDDYKELLQLTLLFLEMEPAGGARIHAPGAFHRARWMAKLIYSLKIFLFRSQFHLTSRELSNLSQFNVFIIEIYLKAWFTSPCAASAPHNDLELLKTLGRYKKTNETIASAAAKSFSGHLWYLSETLVGLAFFDSQVPVDTKVKMVEALKNKGYDNSPRRIKILTMDAEKKSLNDFVSENTRKLFVALDISQTFLTQSPNTWENNTDFIRAQKKIKTLKVVNDAAERGIALIQSFNAVLTNQEEQKQYLLQVVEKHRQEIPKPNKSSIVKIIRKQ